MHLLNKLQETHAHEPTKMCKDVLLYCCCVTVFVFIIRVCVYVGEVGEMGG